MHHKILIRAVLVAITITVLYYFSFNKFTGMFTDTLQVKVVRVIDGDTFYTANGEKVRLLGINAPEKWEPMYNESKFFLKNKIENKTVTLKFDKYQRDKYGRILSYVFLDGDFINSDLLKFGLANVYDSSGLIYDLSLKKVQDIAIQSQVGIWNRSNYTNCFVLKSFSYKTPEYVTIQNKCNFPINITRWYIKDEDRHFFYFNRYIIGPNESVTVYTNNKTAEFSFNSKYNIWNDDGDSIFFRDNKGRLVLFFSY